MHEAELGERVGDDQAAARESEVVEHRLVLRVHHADVQRALLEVERERAVALDEIEVQRRARARVGTLQPLAGDFGQAVVIRERRVELLGREQAQLDQCGADPAAIEDRGLRGLLELLHRRKVVLQQELREGFVQSHTSPETPKRCRLVGMRGRRLACGFAAPGCTLRRACAPIAGRHSGAPVVLPAPSGR